MASRRKHLLIGLGIYAGLWLITGILGLPQVDRAFDEEFALGSPEAFTSPESPARWVPMSRVPYVRIIKLSSHSSLPDIPFRSRSTGFPVAPFLILDEACIARTPLAAFSGRRLIFWFFGYTRWIPLKIWWVA